MAISACSGLTGCGVSPVALGGGGDTDVALADVFQQHHAKQRGLYAGIAGDGAMVGQHHDGRLAQRLGKRAHTVFRLGEATPLC
ncbi:MAG TPA: hypothetical protein VHQ22_14410 [Terriglobales bacterium]|nr:hypothetical protein [Terriglobales bacterium]